VKYIRLFRVVNLLIIALTIISMRYGIIVPLFSKVGLSVQMPICDFCLMIFATLAIGAAGYAINDYFDQKIDAINRPSKVVVGKGISRRLAILSHIILNIVGLLIGLFLAYRVGIWWVAVVYFAVTAIFWFYSLSLKKSGLLGNIAVSSMAFLVPFQVALFEFAWYLKLNGNFPDDIETLNTMKFAFYTVLVFSAFAFLTNFIREITKDFEDIKGDARYLRRSLPIVFGPNKAKWIVQILTLITILLVSVLCVLYLSREPYFIVYAIYLALFIIIPMFFVIYKTHKAREAKQYSLSGKIIKFVMLTGILFPFMFGLLQ